MLKQANAVKHVLTTVACSLEANAGESFLIKKVIFGATATSGYPVFRVDRKTVGCYRGGAQGVTHLGHQDDAFLPMNLMEWLASKGINVTIPVAEGQTFTIERTSDTGDVTIVYDIYDAGDIKADMPNGSESNEYMMIQYMTASAALEAAGDHLLNVSLSPSEMVDFPCGKVVPAKTTIDILGVVGQPVSKGDASTGHTTTQYLKFVKDREVLFDEDRNGIPFKAVANTTGTAVYKTDMSLIGDGVSVPTGLSDPSYGLPLLFDPALRFLSGEELLVYLNCSYAASGTVAVAEVRVGLIMHVMKE